MRPRSGLARSCLRPALPLAKCVVTVIIVVSGITGCAQAAGSLKRSHRRRRSRRRHRRYLPTAGGAERLVGIIVSVVKVAGKAITPFVCFGTRSQHDLHPNRETPIVTAGLMADAPTVSADALAKKARSRTHLHRRDRSRFDRARQRQLRAMRALSSARP